MVYAILFAAVVLEVIGTSALKASEQFTKPVPVAVTLACYGASFFLLSLALRTLPVGIAYAIWSGLGIVLISLVGFFWFKQALDTPAVLGLSLILAGVVVVNVFSKSVPH
ncbi:multidrug efflux SMR transporter [Skermanella sp. TT6]|uniref:Multidrug efflux SMR transporter n=1 Tax=Skermanella cutis TaxID=2775420 RepID=A0ABX7BIM4_9PROT|nr:multidrug efflux SMR transporter [Skermanella sp. TT6]QQP92357.1 multidrug efflux SMR transporter [Skermanella sp. TT6]